MKRIFITLHTLLALAVLCLLCACGESKEEKARQQMEALRNRQLTPEDEFYLAWAKIIAKTEAVNAAADKIIRAENLQEGDHLPPSRLGIKNLPEENQAGDGPLEILFEGRIKNQTVPFWVHVENEVPTRGVKIAFASTIDPQTQKTILYPRTENTAALMRLALLRMKNDQTEAFLNKWKADQALQKKNK